jgi:2-amino-4-hydroxy-6-hydroxymethyldihydropteridine diphosphokinase
VIDLDLLLYEDAVMQTAELVLPHPAMQERAFVLGPLAEIAPGMVHPVVGRSVTEMLRELQEL